MIFYCKKEFSGKFPPVRFSSPFRILVMSVWNYQLTFCFISCWCSITDHVNFSATLPASPQLPHCTGQIQGIGPFTLDTLDVSMCLYVCMCVCVRACVWYCVCFHVLISEYNVVASFMNMSYIEYLEPLLNYSIQTKKLCEIYFHPVTTLQTMLFTNYWQYLCHNMYCLLCLGCWE